MSSDSVRLLEAAKRGLPLRLDDILSLMKSQDLSERVLALDILEAAENRHLLDRPVHLEDFLELAADVYLECMRLNSTDAEVEGPFIAAYSLHRLFLEAIEAGEVGSRHVSYIKSRVEEVYRQGGNLAQDVVVNGFLEHVFESALARKYFLDWSSDPILERAYRLAIEWVQGLERVKQDYPKQ